MSTSSQRFAFVRKLSLALLGLLLMPAGSPFLAELEELQRPEDLFVLRLVEPSRYDSLSARQLILQAYEPYDLAPIEGLELTVVFETDGQKVRQSHVTDVQGEAVVPFGPDSWDPSSNNTLSQLEVTVSASHRGATRTIDKILWWGRKPEVLLSTDRRLYQPEQAVRLRGLWLDVAGRPMAAHGVELRIVDPDDRVVAKVERTTSELGIASFDWSIPATARTGDYRIAAKPGGWGHEIEFRVHPYEPARLLIEARSRRPFFLPGEPAEVEVDVTLPDGTPLPGVRVDMAQAQPRHHGCATRIDSTPHRRGEPRETDEEGRAVIALGLSDDLAELGWHDWDDLDFEVRAEDPLTGRSETLPLTLRFSREPVHFSLLGRWRQDPLPTELWVLVQDAAGEPKPEVAVELRRPIDAHSFETVERVITNRLGLAALETPGLDEDMEWQLMAFDGARLVGSHTPYLWQSDESLTFQVDRPLRQRGEPLSVSLHAARELSRVRIEVASEKGLLDRKILDLRRGTQQLTFPYRDGFEGPLTLQATALDPQHEDVEATVDATAVVIYPGARLRQLELASDRDSYRPGETARLHLEHVGAQGPSAVALAVVDRASEARQASEGLGLGPALIFGASKVGPESGLAALGLGPWRTSALEALDRLPATERQGDDAQDTARALLANAYRGWLEETLDHPFHQLPSHLEEHYAAQGQALAEALETLETELNPRAVDQASLLAELEALGVDPSTVLDPWGQPYHLEVTIDGRDRQVLVWSSGWDTKPRSGDDLLVDSVEWPFAKRLGSPLEKAVARLHREEGRFLTSPEDVAQVLAAHGIDWWTERDPWGKPYQLRSSFDRAFRLQLLSAGPDGRWAPSSVLDFVDSDDVVAWTVSYKPSGRFRQLLHSALAHPSWAQGFDGDEVDFRRRLEAQGADPDSWVDPWGRPIDFDLERRQRISLAGDRAGTETLFVALSTRGADGRRGTDDDRFVGSVTHRFPRPRDRGPSSHPASDGSDLHRAGRGTLSGQILLCDGLRIPGVHVTLTPEYGGASTKYWTTVTDASGRFEVRLPAGSYTLTAELEGMMTAQMTQVVVEEGMRTPLQLVMDVAAEEEIIVVSGASTQDSQAELTGRRHPISRSTPTPRLRRDFEETLFWLAEGRTNAEGRLEVEVPLADNLTRWSVAALASDREGRLSTAQHEILVRQPFALEPDLPPLLTAGDRLGIPVVINNGTGAPLAVDLTASETKAGDFGASRLGFEAPPGVTRRDVLRSFPTPGEQGLRLAASALPSEGGVGAERVADAVWKTTQVQVDGAHQHRTINHLLSGNGALDIEVPRSALEGQGRLEVVVYEGLEEHLLDTLEGLAEKPTGCAEQTTSKAWANLLLLERLLARGGPQSDSHLRAQRHLEIAIEALRDFQRDDGGFGYWRSSTASDAALTAYVVDFLLGVEALSRSAATRGSGTASTPRIEALPNDSALIARAAVFLAAWPNQHKELWPAGRMPPEDAPTARGQALRTLALVARSLAHHSKAHRSESSRRAATKALELLPEGLSDGGPEAGMQESDPYVLALTLHTHLALEDRRSAVAVAHRLEGLATEQQTGQSWDPPGPTPFWGWRRSARLETTALVLEGLSRLAAELEDAGVPSTEVPHSDTAAFAPTIRGGLPHLLLQKGRAGLWGSTQATVRVLQALDQALVPGAGEGPADLQLILAGKVLDASLRVDAEGEPRRWLAPLGRGKQRLEITSNTTGDSTWRLVQVRTRTMVPWNHPEAEKRSEVLDFEVDCGPTRLDIGEQAVCRVEVGRQQRGGMVIAEIGLPPGAEVDRAALLELQQQGVIQRYESWPGRAVLYLWPGLEPIRFELPWRPRLAVYGKAQPSRLWDYYDPDEEVLLAPAEFRIGELP